jgi:glycosyltransferase involved in cell wall biosynthesis
MDAALPFVSVIIPVFNDSDRLRLCLNTLSDQSYPKDLYEIIVVDNNSEEDIQSVVQPFPQVRLAHESRCGSYAARNAGIAIAQGDVLGFTDSDCIPAQDWIEKGVKWLLKSENCGLVAGKIELFFRNPDHPTLAERFDQLNFLQQQKHLEEKHFGATANLFTTRSVFDAIGVFNAGLKSGGDKEWGNRVFAAGYQQIYADEMRITHPARHRVKDLIKKTERIAEGHFSVEQNARQPWIAFLGKLYWEFKPPFREILGIWVNDNLPSVQLKAAYTWLFMHLRWAGARKKLSLYLKHRGMTFKTSTIHS